MFELFWGWLRALFRSRAELVIENLALRQQAAVLKRKRPRPALENVDRAFWVALRRVYSKWSSLLVIVEPETVVQWHRAGFNGTGERWIGSVRREILDHVVILSERQLLRLLREYIVYHHDDRPHLGLGKETPSIRAVMSKPSETARIESLPRLGGLHHRCEWREAA
jgi:hypothetical protein